MDTMMFQELLILVLSIAVLAGGTACIVRRENRSKSDSNKNKKRPSQSVEFIPLSHTA